MKAEVYKQGSLCATLNEYWAFLEERGACNKSAELQKEISGPTLLLYSICPPHPGPGTHPQQTLLDLAALGGLLSAKGTRAWPAVRA